MFRIPDRNTPRWLVFAIDMFIVVLSLFLAYLLRFDFVAFPVEQELPILKLSFPIFLLIRGLTFYFGRSFRGIIRHTGTQDTKRIFLVVSLGSAVLALINPLRLQIDGFYFFPVSILVMEYFISMFMLITFRMVVKVLWAEQQGDKKKAQRIVIYGAGEMGLITKRTLDKDHRINYQVVAFLDDDTAKTGKTLEGVPIYSTSRLEEILKEKNIEQVVIAILNPDKKRENEIVETALKLDVGVMSVPGVEKWINGELNAKQLRKIRIEDLLGRDPISLDKKNISDRLDNKVILVTGAAGSIGSELVRQIVSYSPAKVVLLDQAESPLYDFEMELNATGKIASCELVIGDISNRERMFRLFSHFKPQVVFHAAAYKHVPLMEENPTEAILVNVSGTRNLVDLAIEFNVERFVMVSTDKAVNPTNVMGASKRIAEIYAQSHQGKGNTRFITTRFGNVLGSNGSVIPLFRRQIEAGGPVTVTHPDVTRFFMTIPEACQLVLEAGAMGEGGEIFVFDMGESVKIVDLAKKMIKLSGLEPEKDIEIKYTGLRPGEKLYEEVLSDEEGTLPTHHPQILRAKVREYDSSETEQKVNDLVASVSSNDNFEMVGKMKAIVPEFLSNNSVFSSLDKKQ